MSFLLRPLGRIFVPALLAASACAQAADPIVGPEITSLRAYVATTLLPSSASPLVAVLDTGFETLHPALVTRLVTGYNAFTGGSDVGLKPNDPFLYTHGTAIAGIVSADPTLIIWPRAVFPSARILPIKICCADSSGLADSNTLRQGILYAAGIPNDYGAASPERAAVINISYVISNTSDPGLIDAIQRATRAGSVVVTALGESTPEISPSMASVSGIIGVMTAPGGRSLPLTGLPMPAIPGPGTGVTILLPSGTVLLPIPSWGTTSGSSFATAAVSAVAAMLIAQNPNLSPADVATILSSPDVYDDEGLDAVLAVQMADTLPLPLPLPSPPTPMQGGSTPEATGGASGGGALDVTGLAVLALPALFGLIRRRRRV